MGRVQPWGASIVMIDRDVTFVEALVHHSKLVDSRHPGASVVIERIEPGRRDIGARLIRACPDVVTLDLGQTVDPLGLLVQIYDAVPGAHILFMSAPGSADAAVREAEGRVACVGKDQSAETFFAAIEALRELTPSQATQQLAGFLRSLLVGSRAAPAGSPRASDLSDREREILGQILSGATSTEIAHRLRLSANTIRAHRRRIRAKLGLDTQHTFPTKTHPSALGTFVSEADPPAPIRS